MAQIASRHPSKDLQSRQKAQGSFPGITGETKGKGLAQPIPLDSEGLGEKEEVWKAGAVAYELLVGHPPTAVPAAPPTSTGLVRQTSFLGFLGFLSDDCVNFLQAVGPTLLLNFKHAESTKVLCTDLQTMGFHPSAVSVLISRLHHILYISASSDGALISSTQMAV